MEKDRIFFTKPNTVLLDSIGLMSVDMHFHTRFSDSYTTVHNLLKRAWNKRVGVAITDHNTISGSLKAYDNAKDVMVIPGIEVSCMEGPHMLFYFYNMGELREFYVRFVEPRKQGNPYMAINATAKEILDASKGYNCIRGAAHPFGYSISNCGLSKAVSKRYVDETIFNDIDSMEVICGAMNRRLNMKAQGRCMELGKAFTGGTDGHTLLELGRVVTCSYAHDTESFLNNILKKKNYVIGREATLLPKGNVLPSVVSKHMRYMIPSLMVQYQINKQRVTKLPGKIMQMTSAAKERFFSNGKH